MDVIMALVYLVPFVAFAVAMILVAAISYLVAIDIKDATLAAREERSEVRTVGSAEAVG